MQDWIKMIWIITRYSKDEDMDDIERDLGDEYGWKQVHGDVFRPATSPLFFSALVGSGAQLAFVIFLVVVFTIMGELYTGIHFKT